MSKIFRSVYLIVLFVIFFQIVIADIDLTSLDDEYMLGESIHINASVTYKEEMYGFFKLSLMCPGFNQDYFLIPLQIREGRTANIAAESIRLTSNMAENKDECYVKAIFLDGDGEEVMEKESDTFEIATMFDINIEVEETSLMPGDEFIVHIDLGIDEEAIDEVTIDLTIDKKLNRYEVDDNNCTIKYEIPMDANSGEHEVLFQIEDSYGNYEEEEITIEIASVISSIAHIYSQVLYDANKPGEVFSFKSVLYDQAKQVIDDRAVNVKIYDPINKMIVSDNVISTVRFSYDITGSMKPGIYTILSTFEDIEERSTFEIVNSEYENKFGEKKDDADDADDADEIGGTLNEGVDAEDDKDQADDKDQVVDKISDGSVVADDGTNAWKYLTYILILGIIIYIAYAYGRRKGHKQKNGVFKDNKFYEKKKQSK